MKKIALILLIAIISIQLVAAPNDFPQSPITGTLAFGDLSLPTGVVKGYNITMDNTDYITALGVQSKSIYFTIEAEPKFYKENANGEIVEFEIPFDAGANIRATLLQGDASEVVINRLPYMFAYGDSVAFDLDIVFGGSMYSVIFGRESSNNAITIDNSHGRAFFMYNDVNGGILLLNDDYTAQLLDVGVVHTLSFRPPSIGAAAGEEEEEANARRIGRAGRVADIETQGCTDMDSAEADQYSVSSYGFDETGTVLSDFCATDPVTHRKNLNEVRCNADGNAYLEEHSCAEDCRNGACRPQQAQNEVAFCYDSDLTGQAGLDTNAVNRLADSFSSKGIVAGFYAAGRDISYGIWGDSCSSNNKLVEYYCRAQKARFATIVCGSGCSEGKCENPPYCFDADGGENPGTKGRTLGLSIDPNLNEFDPNYMNLWDYLISNVNNDTCINSTALREFSCENTGQVKEQIITCENRCTQGRCLREGEVVELPKPCTTRNDCNFSQACINTGASASLQIREQNAPFASVLGYFTLNELESKVLFGKTVKLEAIGANNAVVSIDGESRVINLSGNETFNGFTVSLILIHQKEGFCGSCSTARDCGTGWACSSGNCRLASGRCKTSLNCKINQECDIDAGQELGYCQNERLTNLEKVREALERRWARVNAYARIILRFEGLHNLALPPKQSNGQACFVDSQCYSEYCGPQQGKCASSPNSVEGAATLADESTDTLRRIAGEHCTRELQCYSKYEPIVQNACRGNPYTCYDPLPDLNANEQKRGIGRTCRAGSQCLANACNIGICGRKKGQSCTNSDQCLSGDCTNGKCGLSNPKSIDQNDLCSYDNDCIEGYKCSKFHRCVTPQDLKNYNQNCAYNMGCLSGSCVNSKCARSENNGLCEDNADCTSNICSAGKRCTLSNLKSNGESCSYDRECASNKCSYPNPAVPVKKCMAAEPILPDSSLATPEGFQ